MNSTIERYTIISDVPIPSHDTEVRLYWTGDYWSEDPGDSVDMPTLDSIKSEAWDVQDDHTQAQVKILRIKSTMEHEVIDV